MNEMSTQFLLLLVDVSWRIAALAAVVALGVKLGRLRDPALTHLAWRGVLFGMLALPFLSLWAPALSVSPPAALTTAPPAFELLAPAGTLEVPAAAAPAIAAPPSMAAMVPIAGEPATFIANRIQDGSGARPWALFLVLVYGLGVLAMAARLAGAWWLTRSLVADGEPLADVSVDRQAMAIAGGRRVRFGIHPQIRVPLSTGWWRPAVLLPADWRGWDETTRRYAIAHELVHIRRGDYAVQLLAAVNRCLFWFHPLAWMLPGWLASLAERACDREVVQRCGDRPRYARVLLRVAASVAAGARRPVWIGAAMVDGNGLSRRIEAVLATPRKRRLPRRWAAGALAGLVIAGVAGAAVLEVEPAPRPPSPPEAPLAPVVPLASVAPLAPVVPLVPEAPAPSLAPAAPAPPVAPRAEVAPVAPVAPRAPSASSVPAPPPAPPAPLPGAPVVVPAPPSSPSSPVPAPIAPPAPPVPLPGAPVVAPAAPPAPEVRDRPVVAAPSASPALAGGFVRAALDAPVVAGEPGNSAGSTVEPCAVARNYILWFDDQGRRVFQGEPLSASPKGWLEDATRWIREDLCPADRVAIVSFKGRLRVDQDFTLDREAAVRALEDVERWKHSRVAALPAANQPSLLRALPPKRELKRRSREIESAIELLAEAAATVEGRKDLIVLTRGFADWNSVHGRNGTGQVGERIIYKAQAERIRAGGVVVHAIQTGSGSFYRWGGVTALTSRTGGWIYGVSDSKASRAQSQRVRSWQARSYNVLDGLRAIARAIELESS